MIAAIVDSVVPSHLNSTPRRAYVACSGPYSSAPCCILVTERRLTMKLITKTITRPQEAAPVSATAAMAVPKSDATRRNDVRPRMSANVEKMRSRIRFVWYDRMPESVSGLITTGGHLGARTLSGEPGGP